MPRYNINKTTEEPVVKNKGFHSVMIIDCSGSMSGGKIKAAENMFNEEVKQGLADTYTLCTFSYGSIIHFRHLQVTNPEHTELTASGLTALHDAVGKTLSEVKKWKDGKNVLVKIFTDGQENDSYEYNARTVKALIDSFDAEKVTITFGGTERDVEVTKNLYGLLEGNTIIHENTVESFQKMSFDSMVATNTYSKNLRRGISVKTNFYNKSISND